MTSENLLKKIQQIEIKAKGVSKQLFQGSYTSAFKGSGMTFSEVRGYQYGDETRTIDWNVTARFNEPFVKTFEEERELTVLLLVDISASTLLASDGDLKRDYMAELCAVIAFSAIQHNDKVGVLFFSDVVEKYIPPKKGRGHVLRIIRDLLSVEAQHKSTNIHQALQFLNNAQKRRATVFLVSDFIVSAPYTKLLQISALKHDLIALDILANNENSLPNIGWLMLRDVESGKQQLINTAKSKNRLDYERYFADLNHQKKELFKRSGIDYLSLKVGQTYVKELTYLFKRR